MGASSWQMAFSWWDLFSEIGTHSAIYKHLADRLVICGLFTGYRYLVQKAKIFVVLVGHPLHSLTRQLQ